MAVFHSFFAALFYVVSLVLELYIWVLIINAVLSWLVAFDVVNTRNRFVSSVGEFCYRLTEPVLGPLRRLIPPMGGIDLSPVALIFLIIFFKSFLMNLLMGM